MPMIYSPKKVKMAYLRLHICYHNKKCLYLLSISHAQDTMESASRSSLLLRETSLVNKSLRCSWDVGGGGAEGAPWEFGRRRAKTKVPSSLPRLPPPPPGPSTAGPSWPHGLHPRNEGDFRPDGYRRIFWGRQEPWGRGGGRLQSHQKGSRLLSWATPGSVLKRSCGCNDSGWRTFRSQMSLCEQKTRLSIWTVQGSRGVSFPSLFLP